MFCFNLLVQNVLFQNVLVQCFVLQCLFDWMRTAFDCPRSPRVRAAMRVMGIVPSDLEKKARSVDQLSCKKLVGTKSWLEWLDVHFESF